MQQMLEHAREAVEITRGHVPAEMRKNRMLQLALTHLILVTGEAASRVSATRRARYPEIPADARPDRRLIIAASRRPEGRRAEAVRSRAEHEVIE
jgi:uncharacterized protein with HEPN domain